MKINRNVLIEALEKTKSGLAGNKEIIEHSSSFIFLNDKIISYNDKIAVMHQLETGITGVVKAEELLALLKRLHSNEIELNVIEENKQLSIVAGRTKAGIILEFDIPDHIKNIYRAIIKKKTWETLPSNFMDAVKTCLPSVSEDMTRPELTVLHVQDKYMEASDNYRLTRFKLKESVNTELHLPADNLLGLEKISPVVYAVDNSWIHFRGAQSIIYCCRLLSEDIKFPDISPYLKIKGIKITLPAELKEALDRSMVFAGKGQDDVFPLVQIILQPKWIAIKGKGITGWIEEKIRIAYEGELITFHISPKLLMDVFDCQLDIHITGNTLLLSSKYFIHCCSIQTGENQ